MNRFRPLFIGVADMIIVILAVSIVGLLFGGCISPNTGSQTIIGEQMALPSISDSTDSVTVNVYESIKGAKIWTAKGSVVKVSYKNTYDNSYFGIVTSKDTMDMSLALTPVSDADYPTEK